MLKTSDNGALVKLSLVLDCFFFGQIPFRMFCTYPKRVEANT